jgi:hypothetical protein
MAVCAERTAFRAAWLPDGVQALRIAGRPGFRRSALAVAADRPRTSGPVQVLTDTKMSVETTRPCQWARP